MLRFQHTDWLYALLLLPLLIGVYYQIRRLQIKRLKKFGKWDTVIKLIPQYSTGKPKLKFFLYLMALAFLIMGLANPQIGTKLKEVKREGIDIMIAIDLSKSMLSEDLNPNRLVIAKRTIQKFIQKIHSDRIGIVVFAGQAYVQLPITTDYSAAKMFLNNISTELMPTQGTAIGKAIETCMSSFNFDNKTGKTIVIITDGENHQDDAITQAQEALGKGVTVHTIGMGSLNGGPIPIKQNGRTIGYKKDKEGNPVISKLDEQMLMQIASAGGGTYIRANNSYDGLQQILDEKNKLNKTEIETRVFADHEDRFQFLLSITLFLLLLELIISNKKSTWLSQLKMGEIKKKIQ